MKKLILALLLGCASSLANADTCEGFKWDVSHERSLFATKPKLLAAGTDAAQPPSIDLGKLYELSLAPQETVKLATPPGKKSISDGASAGVVRFTVPKDGQYRVALSRGFWIDVVDDGKALASLDFSGSPDCAAPRKVVVFSLKADRSLVLQLSGATETSVKLSVTPVAALQE